MKEWEYSDEYYIRRGVEAIYPKIQVVLISEIFKDSGSKVFSAYDPEFKFFLFKIKTPTGQTYQKHDSGGTGIYRISIPQNQLDHVCKQLLKKTINFVILDYDYEPGASYMKHKIIRSNMCNFEENLNRF